MADNLDDLIRITLQKRKKKATDESEVMASEDDDNPDGAQSSDDKRYKIYIDPKILQEMQKKEGKDCGCIKGSKWNNSNQL